ncbi:MAG: sugar transferase [Candidatus Omnitrophica bacterium]|nr:sugar transferase [Candidatus Omnitrophota bacterium]
MSKTYLLKRPLDLILATVGVFLFLPIWFIIAILIYLETQKNIFYFQNRVGINSKIFKTMKFLTLYEDNLKRIRITRLGKFLRRTALDESLQLLNIIKNEMSFVGPRPLVLDEINNQPYLFKRTRIKPGLTGLAQVSISKESSVAEKFKYDLWYIENQNLILDLKIILLSIVISLLGRWETERYKLAFKFNL